MRPGTVSTRQIQGDRRGDLGSELKGSDIGAPWNGLQAFASWSIYAIVHTDKTEISQCQIMCHTALSSPDRAIR